METYKISPENFDLETTLTCGQTFCWNRINGKLYEDGENHFYTFQNQKPIIVKEENEDKEHQITIKTELSKEKSLKALGLGHDLEDVVQTFPSDPKLEKAHQHYEGLRIIQDEFFPCLISYICSSQMRIERIKEMHNKIAEKYGEKQKINGKELYRFPTQEELSEATEEELRELGIGYRAKYIVETMKILEQEDEFRHEKLEQDYETAKQEMKKLYGVGDKVADCVLLFSKNHKQATPLDTWVNQALEKHYPKLKADKYEETSENLRNYFGEHTGYALEYLFHAIRNDKI